jgi:hypothetical protein
MKTPKLTIKVVDLVRDIRSGLTDAELMKKYQLSSVKLRSALKKLVDAKAISPSELLEEHAITSDDTEDIEFTLVVPRDMRLLSRYDVRVPLTIYAAKEPDVHGTVVNISGRGVGTKGLDVAERQVSTVVIPAEDFPHIEPIVFKARCRWSRHAPLLRNCSCGLEILSFMEGNDTELRKLVRDLMKREMSR